MKKYKFLSTSIVLMLIVCISKMFGFIREMVIAAYYGASLEIDAFNVAQSIPLVLFAAIGAAVTSALIPIYTEINNENRENGNGFISNLLNICLILSIVIVIVCIFASEPLVRLFAPNMSNNGIALASNITKVISLSIIFTVIYNLFLGILNAEKKYYISQLAAIPCSLILILFVILGYNKLGIWAAVIGIIVGTFFQVLMQIPSISKIIKYRPILSFKDKNFKRFVLLATPMIITISFQQINGIVDKMLGSSLAVGSISSLNYAYKLISFVYGVFGLSIMTVLYTKFSDFAANYKKDKIGKLLRKGLVIVSIIILPITIITMVMAFEIVSIVYGRGQFDLNAVYMTKQALFYYAIGMMPMIFIDIINRAFYALKNSKTTLIITSIGVIINALLNIILVRLLGIGGIALGTSIATWIISIILLISISRHINLNFKSSFIDIIKLTIISIPVIFLTIYLNHLLDINYFIKTIVITIVCFLTYIILLILAKVSYIDEEFKKFRKKNC